MGHGYLGVQKHTDHAPGNLLDCHGDSAATPKQAGYELSVDYSGRWAATRRSRPATQLEGAERHARDCPTCGPALAAARAVALELAGLPDVRLPAGLTAGIITRIARLDDGPAIHHRTAVDARRDRPTWAAVLAGIAIGIGVPIYRMLSGEIPLNLTSTRLGGWEERLTDIPTATPAVILAVGLLLYFVGLLAPVDGTDTHRTRPHR